MRRKVSKSCLRGIYPRVVKIMCTARWDMRQVKHNARWKTRLTSEQKKRIVEYRLSPQQVDVPPSTRITNSYILDFIFGLLKECFATAPGTSHKPWTSRHVCCLQSHWTVLIDGIMCPSDDHGCIACSLVCSAIQAPLLWGWSMWCTAGKEHCVSVLTCWCLCCLLEEKHLC